MDQLHDLLIAGLTGFLSGFLLSIPVGPINLTIMNEGARRGFYWAFMIGLGATAMEVIYCFIAFTGFASFFTHGYDQGGHGAFQLRFHALSRHQIPHGQIGGKTRRAPRRAAADKLEDTIGAFAPALRLYDRLRRVLGNLGVLVFWIILAANFISREWVPRRLARQTVLRRRRRPRSWLLVRRTELGSFPWATANSAKKPCSAWSTAPASAC